MSEPWLESPYTDDSHWLRGNLHTHTTNSDGLRDPQVVVQDYADRGYDFLMISDHDLRTEPDALDDRGLILIPGNEVTARGPHLLHVNCPDVVEPRADRAEVLADIAAIPESFAIMAHPNWGGRFSHIAQESLEALEPYAGIEIFNGVIGRLYGRQHALDRWDMLLSRGREVWGFSNDDSHWDQDVELGWNVAQCEEHSAEAILSALRSGRFYASTGLGIDSIEVDGLHLSIQAKDAQRLVLVGDHGRRIAQVDGDSLDFDLPADSRLSYLRVECHGEGERAAWTQPFFVRREP